MGGFYSINSCGDVPCSGHINGGFATPGGVDTLVLPHFTPGAASNAQAQVAVPTGCRCWFCRASQSTSTLVSIASTRDHISAGPGGRSGAGSGSAATGGSIGGGSNPLATAGFGARSSGVGASA